MALAVNFLAIADEWQSSPLDFAWTEVRVKYTSCGTLCESILPDNGAKNLIHSQRRISFCKYTGREVV